ncbi:MAG TPA: aminoacyl-tRNA hydrolase [Terriglobales bacterium]|nr:aminoacyl-tRNA hydrolase [Terriglobales bacterium]
MKLLVGLGNPGIEYQFTPHNLGFLALDRLAERHQVRISNRRCRALTGKAVIASEEVLLAKPETYMNLSGLAVRELLQEYEAEPGRDLVVVYDELDLPLGTIRIRQRGSSAGHKGVESILGALGTGEFTRLRLGSAPARAVKDGARYGLAPFKRGQLKAVDAVLDAAADALEAIVSQGVAWAMNRFNRKPEPPEEKS